MTVIPGARPTGTAGRVLVVDDEPNICALLSATLRLTGFEVRVAGGGHEALVAAEDFEPDLVVLDVMMPELSGWQVLRALRAQPRYQLLPVLMLTAAVQPNDVEMSYDLGASAVIGKPYEGERLTQMVETLLVQADVLS